MVKRLAELGLLRHEPYRGIELTPAGERIALEVVRHHRLLELYLVTRSATAGTRPTPRPTGWSTTSPRTWRRAWTPPSVIPRPIPTATRSRGGRHC